MGTVAQALSDATIVGILGEVLKLRPREYCRN